MKLFFFIGKGGVGKTTLSYLSAYYLAKYNSTAVFSLDQAHNLGDCAGQKLANEPKEIAPNLRAAEVDLQLHKKQYLDDIKTTVKKTYSFLSAYNLLDYFDIFEYSPDIDELSMILAVNKIFETCQAKNIIFDMPPTALTISFLKAVNRNIIWIDKLLELRQKIHKKQEIISRIELGKKTVETDKVLLKLNEMKQFYQNFSQKLQNAHFLIVNNPQTLAQKETERIITELKLLKYNKIHIILNKASKCTKQPCVKSVLLNLPQSTNEFIDQNKEFFSWLETI